MQKAFFLDRDGTINVDYNFVHKPEEWTWRTAAIEAIQWMNRKGFKVIVVTNQSGIARGHYDEDQVDHLHTWVEDQLAKYDAWIDGWYTAPHHPEYDPPPHDYAPQDRKPDTGMFKKAGTRFNIDFSKSYMAGDKLTDIKPAIELNITPYFIRSKREANPDLNWIRQREVKMCDHLGEVIKDIDPTFTYTH